MDLNRLAKLSNLPPIPAGPLPAQPTQPVQPQVTIQGDSDLGRTLATLRAQCVNKPKVLTILEQLAYRIATNQDDASALVGEIRKDEKPGVKQIVNLYLRKLRPYIQIMTTEEGLDYIMADKRRLKDFLLELVP